MGKKKTQSAKQRAHQAKFKQAGKNVDKKGIKRFTKAWGDQFKIEYAKLK